LLNNQFLIYLPSVGTVYLLFLPIQYGNFDFIFDFVFYYLLCVLYYVGD